MSVEEYILEFEQLQIRSGIKEDPEQTMARFIRGLDPNLAEKVDIQPYGCFEDVCKVAVKVEKYSKRKGVSHHQQVTPAIQPEPNTSKPNVPTKTESTSRDVGNQDTRKVLTKGSSKLDGKKCFKCQGYGHFVADCPNRRVLTLKEMDEIDHLVTLEEEGAQEGEETTVLNPDVGDLLIVERVLHIQEKAEGKDQREHIFRSRCNIQDKVCDLVIDGGSSANVASTKMISKLNLPTIPHPHPYNLCWLDNGNKVRVSKQALVKYSIGGFTDEVLCEVLPMDTCHLLLGRPWQFDKGATHHGRANTYSFKDKGQNFVLNPLPSSHKHGEKNASGRSLLMWDPGAYLQ